METIKQISDVIINAMAVGFVLMMVIGLATNANKIKKIEDKINEK